MQRDQVRLFSEHRATNMFVVANGIRIGDFTYLF